MRIRTIRPEFYESDSMGDVSWDARLVFMCLWSYVQDNGVGKDNVKLIRGACMPLDSEEALPRIEAALAELESVGSIVRYVRDGKRLLWIPKFVDYQKITKPGACPLPEPDDSSLNSTESSGEFRGIPGTPEKPVIPQNKSSRSSSGSRSSSKKENTSYFPEKKSKIKPTFQIDSASRAHAVLLRLDPDGERDRFVDHWLADGGRRADWQAMFRGWCDNSPNRKPAVKPELPSDGWFTSEVVRRMPDGADLNAAKRRLYELIRGGMAWEDAAERVIHTFSSPTTTDSC